MIKIQKPLGCFAKMVRGLDAESAYKPTDKNNLFFLTVFYSIISHHFLTCSSSSELEKWLRFLVSPANKYFAFFHTLNKSKPRVSFFCFYFLVPEFLICPRCPSSSGIVSYLRTKSLR
ncbi:hypothetical protein CIPAW_16G004300 [Carya illinoinensis]|uniref:Uncharacterized protein n=1 Tax=Carya illinoinensis TaxID=32201 RepID=A0A8T1N1B0_CARIL|nr:hypothetical protein CIPAW_16G004300 [Carya illinoinensis]